MSIRAMFSGVSGLEANSTWLDVIGNNISNTNTVAYKASRVEFADQISQTLNAALPDTGNIGGTDPVQIGFGDPCGFHPNIIHAGCHPSTGDSTDIAIKGSGFLMAKVGDETLLTRAGNLTFDGKATWWTRTAVSSKAGPQHNSRAGCNSIRSERCLYITNNSLKLDNTPGDRDD